MLPWLYIAHAWRSELPELPFRALAGGSATCGAAHSRPGARSAIYAERAALRAGRARVRWIARGGRASTGSVHAAFVIACACFVPTSAPFGRRVVRHAFERARLTIVRSGACLSERLGSRASALGRTGMCARLATHCVCTEGSIHLRPWVILVAGRHVAMRPGDAL
jgi:hypothetical protein